MRKLVVIYLSLIALALSFDCVGCCLPNTENSTAYVAQPSLTVSDLMQAELLVERTYNSNLEFASPTVGVSSAPVQIVRTPQCITRVGVKCGVATGGDSCNVNFAGQFNSHILLGVECVDYYIFARHQLII